MFCRMLTDGQKKLIHENSLKILERIGVMVPHREVLHLFEEAGVRVNRKESRVLIPGELVLSLIEKSVKRFTLYGRDKAETVQFGYDRRNYNSSAGQAFWIDEIEQQRREPTVNDVVTAARFAEALQCINIVGAMADSP